MPEGDTIFRAARTLNRALAGRTVTRFESVYPALTRIDYQAPLAGRVVEGVSSRGKHVLMAFSGDLVLHTHMRMHGSWHIYRPGEKWQAPSHEMRIVIGTEAYEAVAFNVPVAEFLTTADVARHTQLQGLGPDLADPSFNREEVRRRFADRREEPINDVLLNQQVLSGIGNVLKSEALFVAHLNPFRLVKEIDDATFDRLMDASLRLMKMNITDSSGHGRRTTGSMDPSAGLFVYGRGGKPCRTCGTEIESRKTGVDARLTYWCPKCQA